MARRFIQQDATHLEVDADRWHAYCLTWQLGKVAFMLDGKVVHETDILPNGPLGVVIWIDNQYAALPPIGGVRYGTLENRESAWIEVRELSVKSVVA
jgi:hypothetical protein